jgi:HSP20 family protein
MSHMAVWSPRTSSNLARRLSNWLRKLFRAARNRAVVGGFSPPAEVITDDDDDVRLELPAIGVDKDVQVELDENRLVIHGERPDASSADSDGRVVREVRYGSFHRSFKLPAPVSSDAVSTSYDAGVLTARVAGANTRNCKPRMAVAT